MTSAPQQQPSPSAPQAPAQAPPQAQPPTQPQPQAQQPTFAPPPPGTDLAADLGSALQFTGKALLRNPVSYLVSGLIYSVVLGVLMVAAIVVSIMVMFGMISESVDPEVAGLREMLVFYAVFFAMMLPMIPVALLWQSGAARSAGVVLQGGRPTLGQTLVGPMRIILTALLVGVITLVGSLLLYIPGLIAAVMLFYAIPAAIKGASPIEAIKQSFALAKANLGTTIVSWLVMSVIVSFASMFVLPVLVMIPFQVLFQLGMFERLHGRELPEPAQA